MNFRNFVILSAVVLSAACSRTLRDGEYTLTVLSTNDVHGRWFDSTYVGNGIRQSIFAMNYYIDSVRTADGPGNVLLVDAGDCLQGDNAAFYYNYVDTVTPHLFPRLVEYMNYDAVVVGNHDIETGHKVYDRVAEDLEKSGIGFLGGNAIRNTDGKPYFPLYKMVKRAGLRIAVLGYTNANMSAWLSEEIWSGMHFLPIVDVIQKDVDAIRSREHPDVVLAVVHSASGDGDGTILEAEAFDVLNSVSGLDMVICSHDHRPLVETRDTSALVNSGSHSRFVGIGKIHLTVEKGKVVKKTFETDLIPVKADKADPVMRETFRKEFEAVRAFTLQEVGILNTDLSTRDAYAGMSDYINLLHTLGLTASNADVSFAAPLTFNGHVKSGPIIFNDLFTIYPFENQLYVIKMTGEEIRKMLEASYDRWIQTINGPGEHVLRIAPRDDLRSQQQGWSFVERTYNFDSAGGINYTVDVTQPFGSRITILSMADGSAFLPEKEYRVAMTSYRANGGGNLLKEAGVDTDNIDERIIGRYPEIRNILHSYLMENGSIDPEVIGDPKVIGRWEFIPQDLVKPALKTDMSLLFR